MNKLYAIIFTSALLTFVNGCFFDSDDSPTGLTMSGAVILPDAAQMDSDVNDPNSQYAANDDLDSAQALPNPVTVGGFVTLPASAPGNIIEAGRFRDDPDGDINDFYTATLLAGQTITLYIGDPDGVGAKFNPDWPDKIRIGDPNGNDIDIKLRDNTGTEIQVTVDEQGNSKSFIAPSSGNYYLQVTAVKGASNYVINTGFSATRSTAQNTSALNVQDDFVPGEVIVVFKEDAAPAAANVTAFSRAASVGLVAKSGEAGRSILMGFDNISDSSLAFNTLGIKGVPSYSSPNLQLKQDTIEVVRALRTRPDVKSVRLNYIRKKMVTPNDKYYNLQWHYDLINLPQAWDVTSEDGNAEVIVAVIDTGVLRAHPDLQNKLVPGYDFIRSNDNSDDGQPGIDNNPEDPGDGVGGAASSFHGTHVAGTIAADTNNDIGVAGIGWDDVKIMPLRVLGKFGGTDYDIEQAIRYAAGLPNDSGTVPAQKADIINLSLGGPTNSTIPPPAYVDARNAGVIIVAAAGNEASSGLSYPASLDGVVSVSAVDINGELAPYSNFGSTVDVAAPGGNMNMNSNGDSHPDGVLSSVGDDSTGTIQYRYTFYQGSSMAAPHVAGVAALMKSVVPNLTPQQFDTLLEQGDLITRDLGVQGWDRFYGHGLIDAALAVEAGREDIEPTAVINPKSLSFSPSVDELQFRITNIGREGGLTIFTPNNDSNGWLEILPDDVDEKGLGTYTARISRDNIVQDTATVGAVVTITTEADISGQLEPLVETITLPVMVYNQNFNRYAGEHYVLLLDPDSFNSIRSVKANLHNGAYRFTFTNLSPGRYAISAGSDSDSDNVVCDAGEACGDYPVYGRISEINLSDAAGNISGLDFSTGFHVLLGASAANRENATAEIGIGNAKMRYISTPVQQEPAPQLMMNELLN